MSGGAVTFASLWQRAIGQAAPALGATLIWFVALVALGMAADLSWRQEGLSALLNLVTACAATVAQFAVTRAVVRGVLPPDRQHASFGSWFVLTLIAGIGFLIGAILLILPGIFLAVRWSAAGAALLARDLDVTAALDHSWRLTRGREWPILFFLLSIWVPAILLVALSGVIDPYEPSVGGSLVLNLAANAALLASCHAGVAIYFAADPDDGIQEVFA